MSAQVFVMGLEPGVVSPGFRLGRLRGLDEELARLDAEAKAQGIDPASIRGGTPGGDLPKGDPRRWATDAAEQKGGGAMNFLSAGIGDFVKNIFGQGAAAGSQFTASIAALQQGEAAREQARMMKLIGGGLLAVAVIGGGIFAISRLSKR